MNKIFRLFLFLATCASATILALSIVEGSNLIILVRESIVLVALLFLNLVTYKRR